MVHIRKFIFSSVIAVGNIASAKNCLPPGDSFPPSAPVHACESHGYQLPKCVVSVDGQSTKLVKVDNIYYGCDLEAVRVGEVDASVFAYGNGGFVLSVDDGKCEGVQSNDVNLAPGQSVSISSRPGINLECRL